MVRRSDLLAQLVRYGVRYAPLAYEGLKRGRGPAREFAQARLTRRTARAMAVEHAAHLHEGSILPVYDGDLRVWVVFSGDQVVGTHPVTRTPIETLLAHYDLSKRLRSGSGGRLSAVTSGGRRGAARRTTSGSAALTGAAVATDAPRPTSAPTPADPPGPSTAPGVPAAPAAHATPAAPAAPAAPNQPRSEHRPQ